MQITVHSIVDTITNSSSELFMVPNKNIVAMIYELMNATLRTAGSFVQAQDLYLVELVPEDDWLEDRINDEWYKEMAAKELNINLANLTTEMYIGWLKKEAAESLAGDYTPVCKLQITPRVFHAANAHDLTTLVNTLFYEEERSY